MSKEVLQTLLKYQAETKSKLESKELPAKQQKREASYRAFLTKELNAVTSKIETLKMAGRK